MTTKTANEVAAERINLNYGDMEAFDHALADGEVDSDGIQAMLIAAIEADRTQHLILPTKEFDQKNYLLGLRAGWLNGSDGSGLEFDLDSGAGFGNATLSMSVKFPDGSRVVETVDMRTVATDWVNRIRSEYKGVTE